MHRYLVTARRLALIQGGLLLSPRHILLILARLSLLDMDPAIRRRQTTICNHILRLLTEVLLQDLLDPPAIVLHLPTLMALLPFRPDYMAMQSRILHCMDRRILLFNHHLRLGMPLNRPMVRHILRPPHTPRSRHRILFLVFLLLLPRLLR